MQNKEQRPICTAWHEEWALRSESKLIKYKSNLNDRENKVEIQRWLKKLESTENKIKDLNEILFGIEILKLRFVN